MTYLELRDALNQVPDEMLNDEIESGIIGKDENGNRFSISIAVKSFFNAMLEKNELVEGLKPALEIEYRNFHYTPKN